MVRIARISLVALLVALCATVNHAASIPTTKRPNAVNTEGTTTTATTKDSSLSTKTNDEAQKEEAIFNRTNGRTENARSLDLDINKYTSVDFHNKVYDLQTSPENEKFITHEVSKVHTTYRTSFTSHNVNDYEPFELTTPTSALFDQKHRELQNEIKKKLEIEENVQPIEQIEKPAGSVQRHNNTNLDFVRYTNVLAADDVRNRTSIHRNFESEKGLKINYESVYNQSEPLVDTVQKVHNAKSPLLNNKIENDKAINISKRGFTIKPQTGNSTERTTTDLPQDRSNLIPSLETTTNHEQTQLENNIYPVLVPIPLTTVSTVSTEPSSPIKLYEMTENDFATTTEGTFEADDGAEEKFYEMTETATTTPAPELETTTVDVQVLRKEVEKADLQASKTTATTTSSSTTVEYEMSTPEGENLTTLGGITENMQTTTEYPTPTTEQKTEINTTEHNDESETEKGKIMPKTTTETEILATSTPQTNESNDSTTTEADPASTTVETTTKPIILSNQPAETTTESIDSSVSTIISVIATTIQQIAETTSTYDANAIIKDHGRTANGSVAPPSNEIKKDNATGDHELDDFTEEVTDDDYIDVQRNKVKPSVPVAPIVPKIAYNETVTEITEKSTVTTEEITTNDNDIVTDEVSPEDAARSPDSEGTSSGTIIAIVLSTIGAICLILLAVLLFVMRRRQKRFNYGQRCTPVSLDAYSMDNVSVYNSVRRKNAIRGSKRSYGNPAFDDDTSVSHPLNFQALVRFANNTDDIKAEFEEIPLVSAKMNELPDGCAIKNRYANVIPLPESRVFLSQLEDDPTSDYINANYVTGPKGARGYYIACQAPLHNTVNDFWRMIWEQQSKVILMLTHLFENGVEKCVDYLPPSEVVDCHRLFGDFQVTLKKREVKDKYIISSLQLKNMVSNSWREVTHLWYSGWPEKGVPDEENSIIAFLIEARSYIRLVQNAEPKENGITPAASNGGRGSQPDSSPVVVHCSPGTGRTGSVIACDIAIREFELRRIVDIPRIVYRIRRDRASSVQTKDQYHFIYKVINMYATKLTGGALDSI